MNDLNVPDFKSSDDFAKWVNSLNEKEIKKWTTDDWLKMYAQVDKCVASDEFTEEYKKFVPILVKSGQIENKTTEELLNEVNNISWRRRVFKLEYAVWLGKMYRNYCFEPEQLEQIRKLATQNGEKLAQDGVITAARLAIKVPGQDYVIKYMTKLASDITQRSTSYGTTPETGYVQTEVKIDKNIKMGAAVDYVPGQGTIFINPDSCGDGTINTAFHEACHIYLQMSNPVQEEAAIQKGIFAYPELGEDFHKLMRKNSQYYLSGNYITFMTSCQKLFFEEDYNKAYHQSFCGYKKQPIEKYSDIYGVYAERAYRRASGQFSERTAIKVADYIEKQQGSDKSEQIGRLSFVMYGNSEEIILEYENNSNLSDEEFEMRIKGCFAHAGESLLQDLDISANKIYSENKTYNNVIITVPTGWNFAKKWEEFMQIANFRAPLQPFYERVFEQTARKVVDYIEKQQGSDKSEQIGRLSFVMYEGVLGEKIKLIYENESNLSVEEFEKRMKGYFAHVDESLLQDLNITADKGKVNITVLYDVDFANKWEKFMQKPSPVTTSSLSQAPVSAEEDRAVTARKKLKERLLNKKRKWFKERANNLVLQIFKHKQRNL